MSDLSTPRDYADDSLDASQTTQGQAGLGGRANELKSRAQEALSQGADQARYKALEAKDYANQQFGQAQQVLTDRIIERPLTSAMVALGAGVVLGLALTSGRGGRD